MLNNKIVQKFISGTVVFDTCVKPALVLIQAITHQRIIAIVYQPFALLTGRIVLKLLSSLLFSLCVEKQILTHQTFIVIIKLMHLLEIIIRIVVTAFHQPAVFISVNNALLYLVIGVIQYLFALFSSLFCIAVHSVGGQDAVGIVGCPF